MEVTFTSAYKSIGRGSSGILFPLPLLDNFERGEPAMPAFRVASRWVDVVFPVGKERSTNQMTEVRTTEWGGRFIPRTEIGMRLLALRRKAIDAGMRLLDEDEVLEEVRRRRGERENDEADLY